MLSEKFAAARTQRRREYLMCRPTFFDVVYRINPWMNPAKPVDTALAILQWESLRDLYRELGHTVHEVTAIPGLPDMVYAANGATVIDGRVLGARFRNQERQAEALHFFEWFRVNGFETMREPQFVNEGEGDLVFTGSMILAGHGFRSDPLSHREASEFFDRSVVGLELVDPRFYHLDTALAVLSDNEIMYHPEAFTTESRSWLETHFPDAPGRSRGRRCVRTECDQRRAACPAAGVGWSAGRAACCARVHAHRRRSVRAPQRWGQRQVLHSGTASCRDGGVVMDVMTAVMTRRSELALGAPAPDDQEFMDALTLASAAPDHGLLRPWRWVLMRGDDRELLGRWMADEFGDEAVQRLVAKLRRAPLSAALVFCPRQAAGCPSGSS